jgi:cysteine synthase
VRTDCKGCCNCRTSWGNNSNWRYKINTSGSFIVSDLGSKGGTVEYFIVGAGGGGIVLIDYPT